MREEKQKKRSAMNASFGTSTNREKIKMMPPLFWGNDQMKRRKNLAERESSKSPSFEVMYIWAFEQIFVDVLFDDAWGCVETNVLNGIVVHRIKLCDGGVVAVWRLCDVNANGVTVKK